MNEELIRLLREVKDKWGRETVAAMVKKLDSYPIKWKGTLRRSIIYKQEEGADGDVDFLMADYGRFIDEGIGTFGPRRQAIAKKSIPGIAFHLKPWATSKGLNPWAVATSIVNKGGIKPRPFFNSVIDQRVAVLGNDITNAIAKYMEDSVDKFNSQK